MTNDGNGLTFTRAVSDVGVGIATTGDQQRITRGDLDFDPNNSVEQPNILLRNNDDGTFTDISAASGADDSGVGRGGGVPGLQ